jgi:KDO2-lipid IV(A) lauroyltransferase
MPESERHLIIDGVFATIARLLVAFGKLPTLDRTNIHSWIRYEGLDHYQKAKSAGKGVIVATAHFGNWELSAYAHALMTEPMNVLVRPLENQRVDALVEKRRTGSGNRLIVKKDAVRQILRSLANNEAVGMLVDQNTAGPEGVFVQFFGRDVSANSIVARLAQHSGAPVIPGFATWENGHYVLRFHPEVPMTGDAGVDTQSVQSFLESVIRQAPEQWMWIHRRWKTRPPGQAALYQ